MSTNLIISKPSDEELAQMDLPTPKHHSSTGDAKATSKEGITPYSVAAVVNSWLSDDGDEARVDGPRMYSQFAKQLPASDADGNPTHIAPESPRLTPEGATLLAAIAYNHVRTPASTNTSDTSTSSATDDNVDTDVDVYVDEDLELETLLQASIDQHQLDNQADSDDSSSSEEE